MEIIKLHHPYEEDEIPKDNVVLALGFFDGVHRGHQEVIGRAKKIAEKNQLKLAVMTFNQHPSIVFKKLNPDYHKYLSTVSRKEELMEKIGVDFLYEVDFTSAFAGLAPQEFVEQYIIGLHAQTVVAGFDYSFGKKEVASMEHLPLYAKDRFEIVVVEKQLLKEDKISSTRIRLALEIGDMDAANNLLGYVYATPGRVVHGDARGRLLGFPTANIEVENFVKLPRIGVYAVEILVGGQVYKGMASIGHNVTFEPNRPLTVEVYILDFNEDIYGEEVTVFWYDYLRNEEKFDSIDALIAQLKQDELDTARFFEHYKGLTHKNFLSEH
ncbi:riboflavin biosynthesis protein RibF [Carnobacterium viridans]|uniref:Riboflavin biosynthesis protein n=1 Tax=Carnobacterium viridans TaxID=174587 RepID=A0A1H0XXW0_9LACT|nr:riboflavin biosynthesis protein RibF [Carnobacterium viridans]UDE95460.1 riboflavin biosynthesis protein RibF [Carnobacterium viridans]SDQ07748.1 riboflavin kinase / FMN adenylyltransferase [Carnobacterium viridans]